MQNYEIKNFNYKTKACIVLDKQVEFLYKGLSWLCKQDEKCFIKTVEKQSTKNTYVISCKNGNHEELFTELKDAICIWIGCIDGSNFYRIKIKDLKVIETAKKNKTLNLVLNEKFEIDKNSHIECQIEKLELIEVQFSTWTTFQETGDRAYGLCTEERDAQFKEKNIDFKTWYQGKVKKCCYCGIKEKDLSRYFKDTNKQYVYDSKDENTTKARQRGKVLEIERLVTAGDKNKYYPENTELACYICNNAKSDFISPKNFKPIAEGIYRFWKEQVLVQDIEFDENSFIWDLDLEYKKEMI